MKTMKNKWLVLAAVAATLSSANVHADAPYVSGQVGSFGMDDGNNVFNDLFNDLTGRVAAGYLWTDNDPIAFGVEAGYQFYKKSEATAFDYTASYKRHSFDLLGVADYAFNEKFDLFGKLGVAYVSQKATVSGVDLDITAKENVFTPKAAIGAGYTVAPNTKLTLSLNHEFKRSAAPSASSLMVGVNYSFC